VKLYLIWSALFLLLEAFDFNGRVGHTIAPSPDPRTHWVSRDVGGYLLVKPYGEQAEDSTDVVVLPEGAVLELRFPGKDENGFDDPMLRRVSH